MLRNPTSKVVPAVDHGRVRERNRPYSAAVSHRKKMRVDQRRKGMSLRLNEVVEWNRPCAEHISFPDLHETREGVESFLLPLRAE
jgi:hypothetical protein